MMRAFTHNINVNNVNEALEYSLRYLPYGAQKQQSRAGEVLVSDTPVITCYANPTERVLFSPLRDANPFFHLMEALWMLAGRDDVAFPTLFNSTFGQFSDDGARFWGAYGARWRKWFGYDQIALIIEELGRNPDSRRCVLAMWSPGFSVSDDERGAVQPDLLQALGGGKDVPCNTHIFFRVLEGQRGPQLDMMVNCRSNDIFWGAYGANAVHMSILQEYIASSLGVAVGRYWQNSFNFHVYLEKFPQERFYEYAEDARVSDLYKRGEVRPFPLMSIDREEWDWDLQKFMRWAEMPHAELQVSPSLSDVFLMNVAIPARLAYAAFKQGDFAAALMYSESILATDWRAACVAWLQRRRTRKEQRG